MSICDNIQNIGNTLENNLNNRGVNCTFGIDTGEQTIYDMVKLVNEQNLMGIGDTNIQIIPNRPFVESGETIDVTVRLLDGVGNPLPNKIIRISDGTNSYNGTTDNDGIYTLFNQTITTDTTYTVSYGTETKTCLVKYCTSIDYGTSNLHNDIWTVTNGTMTRESTYTRLVESAQTLMCLMNSAYITPTSTVEFDFKAIDGVKTYALVYIRNGAGGISLANLSLNSIGGDIGEWIHLKIVFNNTDTITIYSSKLDNPITKTLSSTSSNYRLLLYCGGANTELHFKNVRVYDN